MVNIILDITNKCDILDISVNVFQNVFHSLEFIILYLEGIISPEFSLVLWIRVNYQLIRGSLKVSFWLRVVYAFLLEGHCEACGDEESPFHTFM